MLVNANPGAMIRDLKCRIEGVAAALVSKDGAVVIADLPDSVSPVVFSIMCAAIFGAAVTAHIELGRSPPDKVVIEGSDTKTLIVDTGKAALLVAVVNRSADLSRVVGEVTKFSTLLTARER